MPTQKPVALYPSYKELSAWRQSDYPEVAAFLASGESWWKPHWQWGCDYLCYIGRNKSEHTFARFRNEVEKFLLWAFIIAEKPIDQYRKVEILEYADFVWKPPATWISRESNKRFELVDGLYRQHKDWAPFKLQKPKHYDRDELPKKSSYRTSQESLTATFTALSSFYEHLVMEEVVYGNPTRPAKRDCNHFINDTRVQNVSRLNREQWDYLYDTARCMADENPVYERSLFVILTLKVLFLRIGELSERPGWSPQMRHFKRDEFGNWWLDVLGKRKKPRSVSVPDAFMPVLKRYREHLGLHPLPSPSENDPLVGKLRGSGGMTSRHLRRLVQEVFDRAYQRMADELGHERASELKEATAHWLRHTGASMEIERGRALKDLAEDLGHSSTATTDVIYVRVDHQIRAKSGKERAI